MGNCNSSLICDDGESDGPMEFNADIAGIGILISFFFSALAVFAVVTWGYLTATLPSGLLQPTDQHALMLLKSCFMRKQDPNRAEDAMPVQTSKQRSRSRVLVRFLKMLSDQQLITGISILIAALSSRCVIHRYEWHIVTSLAYFSVATHTMSLDVLRDHLAQHTWVRYCRVCFTLLFVVFFSFAFFVDQVNPYQLKTEIIQCALLDWGSVKDETLMAATPFIALIVVPVLAILWGKHISALTRVAAPEATHHRHVTTTLMDRISVHFWSWTNHLSTAETTRLVTDAHIYYDTKIGPFGKKKRASTWYFLEQYHEAYLSEIPVWAFQLVYGTTTTVRAVWNPYISFSKAPSMLGFGQVVAIGLLVLPLLALVEIINEQTVSDKSQPSSDQEQLHRVNAADNSSPSLRTSRPMAQKSFNRISSDSVDQSVRATGQPLFETTRNVAILSLILCAFSTIVMVIAGSLEFYQRIVMIIVVPIWILSKLVIVTKRQISQARFVWREIRSRKTKKASTQPLLPVPGSSDGSTPAITSGSSVSDGPPRLPSLDISDDQRDHAHTTATETSPMFGRPRRQDTEASLGLTAMFNRQDESS